MAVIVPQDDRALLEAVDNAIELWIRALRDEVETLDPEHLELIVKTAKRLATRLDQNLPPSLDPVAVAEIRGILLDGIRKLDEDEPMPLDIVDDFVVRAEAIRHIVRDALDEDLGVDQRNAGALSRLLVEWLPRVTRKQLAELMEIDVRTFHRWLSDGGDAPRRLLMVARLVALLRNAWTPEGVVAWFYRSRRDLGDVRPIDIIDDPAQERLLISAAREGRAQHGS